MEQTGVPGGDSVAGQRALAGNVSNDEQWSNDLTNPSSRQTTRPVSRSWDAQT